MEHQTLVSFGSNAVAWHPIANSSLGGVLRLNQTLARKVIGRVARTIHNLVAAP